MSINQTFCFLSQKHGENCDSLSYRLIGNSGVKHTDCDTLFKMVAKKRTTTHDLNSNGWIGYLGLKASISFESAILGNEN